MLVNCMLDSSAAHSFVNPRIVQSTKVQSSQDAVLTVTRANGSKLTCDDTHILPLTFMVEGEDRQVTVLSQLYVLGAL